MKEVEFAAKIRSAGGRIFIVGGWVRDLLRKAKAHDKDYMVSGVTEQQFCKLFPDAVKVGRSFPVYLATIDGKKAEVAFARKERKTGSGYCGFSVYCDPSVTVEEDLYRRDTTMNTLAMELPERTLIDLYGGAEDIKKKKIRAVSPHFCDDPIRALRAARQAAEFGFTIEEDTYSFMAFCREELAAEPAERLLAEIRRALQAPRPSVFFRCLLRAGLLKETFPELFALLGKTQPTAFHPEGDAFEHTMQVVDEVAASTQSIKARFCGLVHDLGKGTTPKEMEPHHYGHEKRGLAVLKKWNDRMTLPREWMQAGLFMIREHMRAPRLGKDAKIADLLLAVDKSCLSWPEFCAVIRADHHSLPPYLSAGEKIAARMQEVKGKNAPAGLAGRQIGEWIRSQQISVYRSFAIASNSLD